MKLIIKYSLALILVVFASSNLKSQDLIVTQEGDSLNCKITKIDAQSIYFTFKQNEVIRHSLIPLYDVKYRQYDFFESPVLPKGYSTEYPIFRTAIHGGWSTLTGKISDEVPRDFRTYTKELKSGWNYGLDLTFYVSEQIGLGLKYHVYRSKNTLESIYVTSPGGSTTYGRMSDNIAAHFIAPAFCSRTISKNGKNALIAGIGIGYLGYKNDAVLITPFTIKGSTVGLGWDIGYDIGISERSALGLQFSYVLGTLTQYKLNSGYTSQTVKLEKENYQNLSHVDLSVGLRLYK